VPRPKTKNLKKEGNPPRRRNPAVDPQNLLPINPAEVPRRNLRLPNPPAVKNPAGRKLKIKSIFMKKITKFFLRTIIVLYFFQLSIFSIYATQLKITDVLGLSIYSNEYSPVFIGTISTSNNNSSIINDFGSYGSSFSQTSIRNTFSKYGDSYSTTSAYNQFATAPPLIVDDNLNVIGYLTKSVVVQNSIDPDLLISGLFAIENWNFYSSLYFAEVWSFSNFLGETIPNEF
jgi:hypothetical protein